ncbi:MAG: OmpH family outer membrane protein [Planctomycetota bacterium]
MRATWIASLGVLGVSAALLWAQADAPKAPPPSPVIGCVDLDRVAAGYIRGQQKHREAEKAIGEIETRLRAERDRLEKMGREIEMLKPGSEESERRRKEQAMAIAGFEVEARRAQGERDRIGYEHVQARYREMLEALEHVAKKAGLTIVLRGEAPDPNDKNPERFTGSVQVRDVLWLSPGHDITQAVVDRLNEIYPPLPGIEVPKQEPAPDAKKGLPEPPLPAPEKK